MKNDRPGSKSGPKRDSRTDSKSRAKPTSKRDPRSESDSKPKRTFKSEEKSGMSPAAKREQRLEMESSLKKDYKSASKSRDKAPSKRDAKSAFDTGSKKDFETASKPVRKKANDGSFSPKLGLNRPEPAEKKPGDEIKSAAKRSSKTGEKAERGATQAFPPKRYINVYLSLGSNMGDRKANIGYASMLIDKNIGKIAKKSHLYETEPWGKNDQDLFLNQVLMINTTLDPRDLLEIITHIENELGRVRTEKYGPRTIDIDILFYGKRIIRDKGLDIPHPELHKRGFVLVPMMEIAPELEHPVLKQPIDELYMACKDPAEVVMID